MKYVKQFLAYFNGFPTFTARDARLFLNRSGANIDYYRIFMHNIVKSGRAFAIRKGHYSLHDDPMIAGFAFSPFYYGLETALTHYKLWDYMTPLTIITVQRVSSASKEILGRNVSIRRIARKNLFGYSMIEYKDGIYVPISDIEKTLIDSVYFNAGFNREVYRALASRIDRKRLQGYLKHYSAIVRKRVYDKLDLTKR